MAGGHSTAGFHGKPPADWADALRDRPALPPSLVKHYWYDGPDGRQAALLVKWRSIEGHYDGLILAPVLEPGGWVVVEMWVEAAMLSPT